MARKTTAPVPPGGDTQCSRMPGPWGCFLLITWVPLSQPGLSACLDLPLGRGIRDSHTANSWRAGPLLIQTGLQGEPPEGEGSQGRLPGGSSSG